VSPQADWTLSFSLSASCGGMESWLCNDWVFSIGEEDESI
jgi:hypothetical protein